MCVNKIYGCCTVYIDFSQYMPSHKKRNIYYNTVFSLLYFYTSRHCARILGGKQDILNELCLETEFVFCDMSG